MNKEQVTDMLNGVDFSAQQIEKELKMPATTLAKAISGKRPLPKKFVAPLIRFCKKHRPVEIKKEVKMEIIVTKEDEPLVEELIEKIEEAPPEDKFEVIADLTYPWAPKVEAFCNEHNITPEDLMEAYGRKTKVPKPDNKIAELLPNDYLKSRQNRAMGLK